MSSQPVSAVSKDANVVAFTEPANGVGAEVMECPLCLGTGALKRSEVLERLGVKDFQRVAQLSAEEAFRLLLKKQREDEAALWQRFDAELTKRNNEIAEKYKRQILVLETEKSGFQLRLETIERNQETLLKNARESERLGVEKHFRNETNTLEARIRDLEALQSVTDQTKDLELGTIRVEMEKRINGEESKNADLSRKLDDHLAEISNLREKNHNLELEMSKIVRIGKKEESSFEEEARTWPGIWISEKLKRYGDYLLAYRDSGGTPLDPRMLVDNKDKEYVTEKDVEKLVEDAKEQGTPVAVLVTREENQLRQIDRDHRWSNRDGVWVLRTTRAWVSRDLDVLRPIVDQMRTSGPDFLRKNAVLAEEVRRTLADIDEIERELRKAAKSIDAVKGMCLAYKERLQKLCQSTPPLPS
jgi:hypothetical protein